MRLRVPLLVLLISLLNLAAIAQETQTAPAPDEKAMMEAWMKASTPGDAHKKLESLVGTFNVKVKTWMKPGDPAAESSGVSEHKWVLGNRWVEQRFEGSFLGMPFSGIGYTGYDNIKKAYVGTWMDNMSTAMMLSTGSGDDKSMTFKGTMADPMSGKDMPIEEKITITDKDTFTMEMWAPDPSGKMFKNMEILYERKK